MRYAWYGDDFTGAADTLATVVAGGLRGTLFLAPPDAAQLDAVGPLDALGIAGTARGLDPAQQDGELAPVAAFLSQLRPLVTHYKCCSTFDSAPGTGNLWRGAQALRRPDQAPTLLVLGGQPSLGRYCAFGHLFASDGPGGPVHRIDRHPTMSRHPVTPMHEADLARHLSLLGGLAPGAVAGMPLPLLDGVADAPGLEPDLDSRWAQAEAAGAAALLMDATRAAHLAPIGRAWWRWAARAPLRILGASGVAQALIAAWPARGERVAPPGPIAAADGPVCLLVGSLSPVTAAQVAATGGAYAEVPLDAAQLAAGGEALERLALACATRLNAGQAVLARTSAPLNGGPAPLAVAQGGGRLLARVLQLAPGVRRIGVAGGDSASWALRALAPWALQGAGQLAAGVPLLRARAADPRLDGLEVMLKGGQMGPPDLFQRLLAGTAGPAGA